MRIKRPGRLRPDEPGLGGAGLAGLVGALTAAPSPAELAGEQEALAAFRTVQAERAGRAAAASPSPGPVRPRRPARLAWRLRAGLAGATAAALAGAMSAAYAAALPAPVQHFAYHVLGFAGIPDSGPAHDGSPTPGPGSSTRAGSASPPSRSASGGGTGSPSGRPSPGRSGTARHKHGGPKPGKPGASGATTITIAAPRARVAAGTPVVLTARARSHGRPERGITLRLQERPVGQARWRAAGAAVTAPGGTAMVKTAPLTASASFRFTDAAGDVSATVTVTVAPAVTARLARPPGKDHVAVSVSAPLASPGDRVILQVRSGRTWRDVRSRRLGQGGEPVVIAAPLRLGGRTVRVLVPATGVHAAVVSSALTLPRA